MCDHFVLKTYIGHKNTIRILSDVKQYAYLEDIEAYIIQIDFEKAFDSIEWHFLFESLKALNFGSELIYWIRTTDISACVGNNGY